MSRSSNVPAAYLVPVKDNKVLLLKRKNTGFHDGEYSFIAGHVEDRESFSEAIIREAREESGMILKAEDIKAAHIMHRNSDDAVRVDVFFTVSRWEGEPENLEPEKCDPPLLVPSKRSAGEYHPLYQTNPGNDSERGVLQRRGLGTGLIPVLVQLYQTGSYQPPEAPPPPETAATTAEAASSETASAAESSTAKTTGRPAASGSSITTGAAQE